MIHRKNDSLNKLLSDVMKDLFGYTGPVSDRISHEDVAGWDSLGHIGFIEELERVFNIKISSDELMMMIDLAAVKRVLRKHGVR
ncbi:MAG: acyl carrier protein [Candidatus Binatia bacterium]